MIQNPIFDPLNHLQNIGTSLTDFKEIEKDWKPYFILGKGNFSYTEKMTSIKDKIFMQLKN